MVINDKVMERRKLTLENDFFSTFNKEDEEKKEKKKNEIKTSVCLFIRKSPRDFPFIVDAIRGTGRPLAMCGSGC